MYVLMMNSNWLFNSCCLMLIIMTMLCKYAHKLLDANNHDFAMQMCVLCKCSHTNQDVWTAGPQEFLGAIAHLPRKTGASVASEKVPQEQLQTEVAQASESEGYVACILLNGATQASELLVFAAADIAAGPVVRYLYVYIH